ncbi:hypothetical protein FACS1894208_11150 [Clostridia bacterium]|nr:hypothetical protein FACS1894208_11150 [Clostridia bacterium]
MKKLTLCLIIIAALTLSLTACTSSSDGGPNTASPPPVSPTPTPAPPQDTLKGTTAEILEKIIADANKALGEDSAMPMSFTSEVTEETSEGNLGLTSDQFKSKVKSASVSTAAIGSFAHEIALVQCANAEDAAEVKGLIAKGFDSGKWICVFPDRSVVIDSVSYVLLVAAKDANIDAVVKAFTDEAGDNAGKLDVFYTLPK